MTGRTFEDSLNERANFDEMELAILQFWRDNQCFKRSLELSDGLPSFTFYDGPPFATGLPHYGHMLAGSLKDAVTRYAHQTGHHVPREFGWDCHGLPVEHEIDIKLKVSNREDIVTKIGIANYNEECRSIVMKYSKEWESSVERLGRWIDFQKGYKTMNKEFMESVWWVFSQLFAKKLVYKDYKVMPFSTKCMTPLANFEAGLNYKDVSDPSIIVAFKFRGKEGSPKVFEKLDPKLVEKSEFIAWTTTPWTIPANMALTVHPEFKYSLLHVLESDRYLWVADCRSENVLKDLKLVGGKGSGNKKDDRANKKTDDAPLYEWVSKGEVCGADLTGIYYEPAYTTFWKSKTNWPTAWRVIADTYVTSDSGTGIVHCAPAYGEDDARVALANGITSKGGVVPLHVDDSGMLMDMMDEPDLVGVYIKDADKIVRKQLKERSRLLFDGSIVHSYPHCWRSDTPLIYRAVPSWFVNVESIKDDLIKSNQETKWVPSNVQTKRFHNWLVDARDWCISRNRFWGAPLPLWVSADGEVVKCIGSIKELEAADGVTGPITDIHRHFIDHLTFPDPRGPSYPPLRRVDEVFDCWFESGSMPYASKHYPFENAEQFERRFPADFVGEGLDQTRGWFYTLSVIGTALFKKAPFKNLIVNGLVLAEDGKKMSKRLKNYPDPAHIFKAFGADALRIYLISSPALKAESLRFKEDGLKDVMKNILLPWYHSLRFLTQEVTRFELSSGARFKAQIGVDSSLNDMDLWILSAVNSLVKYVHEEMSNYRLYSACNNLLSFMDQLTNWYVRLNRERMRSDNETEKCVSLSVLYKVLLELSLLMSPFAPFMAEFAFQQLVKIDGEKHTLVQGPEQQLRPNEVLSVHYMRLPKFDEGRINLELEQRVRYLQEVIVLGRQLRDRKKITIKQPLGTLQIRSSNKSVIEALQTAAFTRYVQAELNCMQVEFTYAANAVKLTALPALKILGPKFGLKMKELGPAIRALSNEDLEQLVSEGQLVVLGETICPGDVLITKTPIGVEETETTAVECGSDILVVMDVEITEELKTMHRCRELSTRIQKLRKEAGLKFEDNDNVTYIVAENDADEKSLNQLLETLRNMVRRDVRVCRNLPTTATPPLGVSENVYIFAQQ